MNRTRLLRAALAGLLALPAGLEASTFSCGAGDVGCLIAAINTANANGEPSNTIRLAAGTYSIDSADNDTDGPNGLPAITSTLSIVADVAGSSVILTRPTSAPAFRFLHVNAGGDLTMDGVTLTGGSAGSRSTGPNSAIGLNGGALYNAGGTVRLDHAVLTRNQAPTAGAIYNDHGTLTIANSSIDHNNASSTGGVADVGGTVTISQSILDSNSATGSGGAIHGSGSILLSIADSRIAGNSNLLGAGLRLSGGRAIISRTTFAGNIADTAAIALLQGAQVVVQDSAVVSNTSTSGPGSITIGDSTLEIVNTTITGNRSLTFGPVIVNGNGSVTVRNSTIADNGGRARGAFVNGSATVHNTIVRDTNPPDLPPGQSVCPTLTLISLGHNVFDGPGALCGVALDGTDILGDSGLGTLSDTGRPGGAYRPLLETSPAINAGDSAACPATDQLGHTRTGVCDIGAVEFGGGGSTTPSTSGTRVPPAPAIIDLALASWTFGPNGETLRNGVFVEGYGTQYLWFQSVLYVFGLDGNWWHWTGSFWDVVGPNDPSGNGPAMQPSPSGTRVPPAAAIVDAGLASWTLGPGGETLRNGLQAGGGVGSQYLWYQNVLYTLGSDGNWWQWTGSGWVLAGASDPAGGASGGGTSSSGTHATTIVDGDGATWTIGGGGETLRAGAHAGGGYGSLYLWYKNVLYVLGSDTNWWRWTGSGWVFFGATDPSGGSSGPGTSPSGTHATTIVDSNGATWTLGANGETLRNGTQAAGGVGSLYLWYQDVLYVIGSDNNWWRWTGSGWVFFGPADPSQ